MSVVDRIRDALSGATNRAQPRSSERTADSDASEQRGRTGTSRENGQRGGTASSDGAGSSGTESSRDTNLYHCDPCGTTYVSTELDACSQCDAPVERVPTEQELGLV